MNWLVDQNGHEPVMLTLRSSHRWNLDTVGTFTFVLLRMKRVRFFGNSVGFGIWVRSGESQISSSFPSDNEWERQLSATVDDFFDVSTCRETSSSRNVGSKYSCMKMHWDVGTGPDFWHTDDDWPNDTLPEKRRRVTARKPKSPLEQFSCHIFFVSSFGFFSSLIRFNFNFFLFSLLTNLVPRANIIVWMIIWGVFFNRSTFLSCLRLRQTPTVRLVAT